MKMFATNRQRSSTAARRGLGVLVLLWLNLVLTPCAMALGAEHACDHLPAKGMESMQEMAGHHEHGVEHQAPPCDSVQAECCDIVDITVDTRKDSKSLQAQADSGAMSLASGYTALQDVRSARFVVAADPPDPPHAHVPHHVIFCVYLD